MTACTPLSQSDSFEPLASFCKAAGDPLRLNILRVLSNNSFGVLELAHIFAMGQSGISHHLKVLTQAGLATTRREGNAIFYRRSLTQAHEHELHSALLASLDAQPIAAEIATRINEIHRERASASEAFFQRVAHEFNQHQDLIVGLPQYRDSLTSLLDSLEFPEHARATEIGPGDGSFLPDLAKRFAQVLAVDNSSHMLQQAQHSCTKHLLENVELMLADALSSQLPPADCVLLNMVLHHFAAPAAAIEHLAQAVKPGGSLIISELCRHDQDWVQQACGDLWLGFEQSELTHWAEHAGLISRESIYLGLKNGFQIQLRHFGKPDSQSTPNMKESI